MHDFSKYQIVRNDYWKEAVTHFGSIEQFKKYENAVFYRLDIMESGQKFNILKNVSVKNIKYFIQIAVMFIIAKGRCGINYYFNDKYTIIEKI